MLVKERSEHALGADDLPQAGPHHQGVVLGNSHILQYLFCQNQIWQLRSQNRARAPGRRTTKVAPLHPARWPQLLLNFIKTGWRHPRKLTLAAQSHVSSVASIFLLLSGSRGSPTSGAPGRDCETSLQAGDASLSLFQRQLFLDIKMFACCLTYQVSVSAWMTSAAFCCHLRALLVDRLVRATRCFLPGEVVLVPTFVAAFARELAAALVCPSGMIGPIQCQCRVSWSTMAARLRQRLCIIKQRRQVHCVTWSSTSWGV